MKKALSILMLTALGAGATMISEPASFARSLPHSGSRKSAIHKARRHRGKIARTVSRRKKKGNPAATPSNQA